MGGTRRCVNAMPEILFFPGVGLFLGCIHFSFLGFFFFEVFRFLCAVAQRKTFFFDSFLIENVRLFFFLCFQLVIW